jgi:2-polyprenyl-3-methyl-5-hydroxy-6-metoxy-1,4-benzoquinol methylase
LTDGRLLSAYPPDGLELRLIERFTSLRGKRVLEIGCGDGRLTLQYAPEAASVLAIDPDRASIDEANWQRANRRLANVDFRVGSIEQLPGRGALFDAALFGWSL